MQPPLIVHVIHHLGVGGLENGLVNLINHIPPERYRHAIICLKGYSDFRRRIIRENVEIVALNKREGQDFSLYLNLFKTLRRLKPDIVHTRNLGTMEGQVIAAIAGRGHESMGSTAGTYSIFMEKIASIICCVKQSVLSSIISLLSAGIWRAGSSIP